MSVISRYQKTWTRLKAMIERMLPRVYMALMWTLTLPYYRYFQVNTLSPIQRISKYASLPDEQDTVSRLLVRWRTRKLEELRFITIACAVLAGAVIGAFSWTSIIEAYWLAQALWYCCLVLTILGILLAAQQISVLEILGPVPTASDPSFEIAMARYLPLLLTRIDNNPPMRSRELDKGMKIPRQWAPKWKMIFTWQCPVMFMSYSVCLFLAGLTLVVCTPLIKGQSWSGTSNIAILYLSLLALGGSVFVSCSYWVYHFVDLEEVDTRLEAAQTSKPLDTSSIGLYSLQHDAHAPPTQNQTTTTTWGPTFPSERLGQSDEIRDGA